MIISTRGRYALRVMVDLAENGGVEYIPLKDISKRNDISQKYMESIMALLSKNNMVDSVHGKGGGYRLNRKPEDYKVGEVLRLTEKSLAPVSCMGLENNSCENSGKCRTFPLWIKLNKLIMDYLDSVTIQDLMRGQMTEDFVI